MVTTEQLAEISGRYDTAMSRAMRKALGLPMPAQARRPTSRPPRIDDDGVRECFANRRRVRL